MNEKFEYRSDNMRLFNVKEDLNIPRPPKPPSATTKSEKFIDILLSNSEKDYGLCPPPLNAQEGLNILIEHFLGKGWYVTMPLSQEQVNTQAVHEILEKYSKKRG